jgi:hypothetical protein
MGTGFPPSWSPFRQAKKSRERSRVQNVGEAQRDSIKSVYLRIEMSEKPLANIRLAALYVRFSNRPVWVKHF